MALHSSFAIESHGTGQVPAIHETKISAATDRHNGIGLRISALGENLIQAVRPASRTSRAGRDARKWADLPAQAIKYVRQVEELIGAPVALLSTSPERDDTILVTDPFED